MKAMKRMKNIFIVMSVLYILLGACLIIWPTTSAGTICLAFGMITLMYGVARIVGYFMKDDFGIPYRSDFALGIIDSVVGLFMIWHPEVIVITLPIIIGFTMMIDGVMKIQSSVELRRFGYSRWWLSLIIAICMVVVGILMVLRPFGGMTAIAILTGISLILMGVMNLWTVDTLMQAIRDAMPLEGEFTYLDDSDGHQ